MNSADFRKLINLFDARIPGNADIEYQDTADKVVALLKSYPSGVYTKLGQKVERIKELQEEISTLEKEIKRSTREDVAELFDAEDVVKTRVIETLQFIFTLSKDPKPTVSPQYKNILEELTKHLTPELIMVLEEIKSKMVTVTEKSPSLKVARRDTELSENILSKFKDIIFGWARKYDAKLNNLKSDMSAVKQNGDALKYASSDVKQNQLDTPARDEFIKSLPKSSEKDFDPPKRPMWII